MTAPDVAVAMRKAAVVWLAGPGQPAVAAWCLWRDGSAYVVGGPGEQPLTGIADDAEIAVIVRSAETRAQILSWQARVTRLSPGGEEWGDVVPALLANRRSATADAAQRWATHGRVLRLTPTGPG